MLAASKVISDRLKTRNIRRAEVARLLPAGMTIRAISAETGIPVSAVHRAKRQIEKARATVGRPQSYVLRQEVDGIRHDIRHLSTAVYERDVTAAIGRRLLEPWDRDKPWTVMSALIASKFSDHTIHWLHKRGLLPWGQRTQGEAIIAAVNQLIARQR